MDHRGRENGKAHCVSDRVGRAQEHRRVRLVLDLVECAIRDDLRDIIGHTGIVVGIEDRKGHELGEEHVLDCACCQIASSSDEASVLTVHDGCNDPAHQYEHAVDVELSPPLNRLS